MANYNILFNCVSGDGTTLETHVNSDQNIYIGLYDDVHCMAICLDKSTAIKFAKTLRTEINKIQDDGRG